MSKWSLLAAMIAVLFLSACAGQKLAERSRNKSATIITVARNGNVSIDQRQVQLHSLVDMLKSMGVTRNSRLAVEGATGTSQQDIERVLETLAEGGLLPPGTID
jgi:biopolymer transport protein ExbD